MEDRPGETVSIAEAVRMLDAAQGVESMTASNLRQLLRAEKVRGALTGGKKPVWRVYRDEVERLMRERRQPEDHVHRYTDAGLVERLEGEVVYLRELLDEERAARTEEQRRHDTLMQQLMSRLPELEAPSEPSESPVSAAPPRSDTQAPSGPQKPAQRSWWRRLLGT